MTNQPLQVAIIAHRIMTKSTAWWAQHSDRNDLYCIHNRKLTENCGLCEGTEV